MTRKPTFLQRAKVAAKILAGYHMQEWTRDRRVRVDRSQRAHRDIPYSVRRKMLDWSRELERRDPLFNRFLDLCEQYAVGPSGLKLASASSSPEWNAVADAEWDAWQPWCDISSLFSFGQRQSLIMRELAVAGEVFVLLWFGSSGRPRIKLVPSEDVETPLDLHPREGKDIFDGVECDENGRPLAYHIRDLEKQPGIWNFTRTEAEKVIHIFDPSRIGQTRGLPIVYPVLKDLLDLSELQDLEMLAAKDAASTSKVVKTATGELSAEQIVTGSSATDSAGVTEHYKEIVGAETVVLYPGDEYQQFQSTRPSVAVQSFWDYVSARSAAGLGLPIEILIMRSLQGTMARGAYSMASSFFGAKSSLLAEYFSRIRAFVLDSAPQSRRNRPADWRKTRYTPPKSIDVDVGYNSEATLKALEAGITTFEAICAASGQDWREVLEQKAIEAKHIRDLAVKYGVDPSEISTRQIDRPERIQTESSSKALPEPEPIDA